MQYFTMFPSSNSNGNNDTTIAYIDHSILHRHFCSDIGAPYNYNYNKQQQQQEDHDLPLSIFHFPSPYYNQCELELEDHDLFFPHQQTLMNTTTDSVSGTIINMPGSGSGSGSSKNEEESTTIEKMKKMMPKTKRLCSKRDRHSKINTAKGPRDRRMRLSLDVARDFFGLQDILGYDKASRTVEWLLIQAKPEINKLAAAAGQTQLFSHSNNSCSANIAAAAAANLKSSSPSSTNSEAEVVSGIIDKSSANAIKGISKPSTKGKKVRRQPRKTTFGPLIARDLREKARARAKARTKEKIMWRAERFKESDTSRNSNKLMCSWSNSLETTGEESSGIQDQNIINITNPSLQLQAALADQVKELSPNWIFNCLQNAGINQEVSNVS